MAIKYLQMLSTRRTRIGVLRFGVIYTLEDKHMRVANVIAALTDKGTKGAPKRPAAVLLTKKQVDAKKAEVETLIPDDDPEDLTDDGVLEEIAALKEKVEAQADEINAMNVAKTALEGEVTTGAKRIEELEAKLKAATETAES